MKRPALVATLIAALAPLLLSQPAHAQRLSKVTGLKLASLCDQPRTRPLCDAYIAGFSDGLAAVQKQMGDVQGRAFAGSTCIPEATTTDTLRSTIDAYIRSHGELGTSPAARPAYEALHAAFPCPKPAAP